MDDKLYKFNASRILSCYSNNENLFEKGGKRAFIGEVRVYNNGEKWMKTENGWKLVHDIFRANNGGYNAYVTKVDPDNVHFEKHGRNGHMGTYGKMPHQEFRDSHTPKVIHEVSDDSTGMGTDSVKNYHKNPEVVPDTSKKSTNKGVDTTKIESKGRVLSDNGVKLIKDFEGLRLHAYQDQVGVWTIGYGSTYHLDGTHVKKGDVLKDKQEASDLFKDTMKIYEKSLHKRVKVPLTQNQTDALLSFTFNAGIGAGKTLFKKLNDKDYKGAADEFLKWDKATDQKTGKKVVVPDLKERREKERELFLKPDK